jgi:hypothetical protein
VATKIKTETHDALLTNRAWHEEYTFNDPFYKEIFALWQELHDFNPINGHHVCNESICNNVRIKIDGKIISNKQWNFPNIRFIQDLLDDEGKLASNEYLNGKFEVRIPVLLHNGIINTIPQKWKDIIKEDKNINNYVVFKDFFVMINNQRKKLEEITTKDLYWHLVQSKCKRPTSENKWQEETGLNFNVKDWEEIYMNIYKVTRDTKLITFKFKVTHRILACKRNLQRWKIKDDNLCDMCGIEIDNIEHHLLACSKILPFWDSFFNWWKISTKMAFPVDTYNVILGIPNQNDDVTVNQLNYMLLQGTYFVYSCRQQDNTPELYNFLMICKNELNKLQIIMTDKGQEEKFTKSWKTLYEIF